MPGDLRLKIDGKEPKDARRGCAIAIAIMRRRSPGIFRLFAIGELVGYHCRLQALRDPRSILVGEW